MTNSIQSIALGKLAAHPGNANRMSKTNFAKLVAHIKRTGRYEPIVVRPHPKSSDRYQILNGHHRLKALEWLEYSAADCVVWQVDDGEADVLLATLNRLAGRDELHKKNELIKRLSNRFSIKEMVRMLPDSKKQLERLKNLQKPAPPSTAKWLANAMVFFLDDEQKSIVDKALKLAREKRERRKKSEDKNSGSSLVNKPTAAKRRADALVTIAQAYLKLNIEQRATNNETQEYG